MSETEFNQLKDAVTSLAAKNESGFRSMKSMLKKVLRRVTPSNENSFCAQFARVYEKYSQLPRI